MALFLGLSNPRSMGNENEISSLAELNWEHRVLLVCDEEGQSNTLETLEAEKAKIDDRDLVWLLCRGEDVYTNADRRWSPKLVAEIRERFFGVGKPVSVLIGKDGGVKSRSASLDLEPVFGLIDTMPMRRAEMRRNGD